MTRRSWPRRSSVVLALAVVGCSHTYDTVHVGGGSPVRLERRTTVYVARPANGQYAGREYPGSADATVAALGSAFGKYAERIETGTAPESLDEALASARTHRARYLVLPEIRNWEDRATEWSGIPDRIEVRVSVFDAGSGALIDAVDLTGTSRWGTFGGDHPQDLLPVPVGQFVDALY